MSLGHSTLSAAPLGALSGGLVAANVTQDATGFVATQFGAPSTPGTYAQASAVAPATGFGTPDGSLYQRAGGFSSTVFGGPVALAAVTTYADSDPPTTATIAFSSFSDGSVASDFGAQTWSTSVGTIAGGTYGDHVGYSSVGLTLPGLDIVTSGYYTVTATAVSVGRPAYYDANRFSIDLQGPTETLTLFHQRTGDAADNDYTYIGYGASALDNISTRTPYATGSTHTIQFEVSPTQTTTTVDGVVMSVAAVTQGVTLLNGLSISVLGLLIDSISVVDTQAAGTPHNFEIRFGSPAGVYKQSATSITSTVFGTPATPVPQTVAATGYVIQGLGRPTAGTFMPAIINQTVSSTALRPTVFGLATTSTQVGEQASGSSTTALGAPTARAGQNAQTITPAATFGTPVSLSGTYAAGFKTTALGLPASTRAQPANSTYRATRWGTPTTSRPDTYPVRSAYSLARFGKPSALHLNAYGAASLAVATQISTPSCHQKYRAFHLYPGTRFGKPLKTGQTC